MFHNFTIFSAIKSRPKLQYYHYFLSHLSSAELCALWGWSSSSPFHRTRTTSSPSHYTALGHNATLTVGHSFNLSKWHVSCICLYVFRVFSRTHLSPTSSPWSRACSQHWSLHNVVVVCWAASGCSVHVSRVVCVLDHRVCKYVCVSLRRAKREHQQQHSNNTLGHNVWLIGVGRFEWQFPRDYQPILLFE